jgi:hypothetical protein
MKMITKRTGSEGNDCSFLKNRGTSMKVIVKKRTIDEIIGYWIELEYIQREIVLLEEYTDEVGEIYEFSDWLAGTRGDDEKNVMNVHDTIEEADFLAMGILEKMTEKLKYVLTLALENATGVFAEYQNVSLLGKMDSIIEYLSESFEDIYSCDKKKQLENFYRVLHEAVDYVTRKK